MIPLASHTVQTEQVCRTEQLVLGPWYADCSHLRREGGKNEKCVYFGLDLVWSHRLNGYCLSKFIPGVHNLV